MLLSKGLSAVKAVKYLKSKNVQSLQFVRNSGHMVCNYRTAAPPVSKGVLLTAEIVSATAWWWILWHIYTEPGHIIGEFGAYPDPNNWTDEELGIPAIE